MKFALKTGLALRHGERTLEVVRILPDGDVQIEDTLTRRPRVMKQAVLLRRIWDGQYAVLYGELRAQAVADDGTAREHASPGASALIDLTALPDRWRAQVELRLHFLRAMWAGHVSRGNRRSLEPLVKATAKKLGLLKAPSTSAVMEWARRYETSNCNPLALVSLANTNRRARRIPDAVDAAIAAALRREYFTRAKHSLRHALDCIQKELAEMARSGVLAAEQAKVSYTTVFRRTRDVDVYHRIASRDGDSRARMVCRSAIDGAAAAYPLQRVEIDHTLLDWVVVCDRTGLPLGRPTLTVAVDAFSNYVVGFYLSFYGPGVTSVSGVLQNSIERKEDLVANVNVEHPWLSHGLADEWVLDNGLEFHSHAFKAMCWSLAIDMTYCRVRTPWLKPHVERFFAGLQWLTLSKGRVRKKRANVLDADPYKDAAIGFTDLVKGLTMFVVDVHPFQVNERKLARPFDLFSEGLERCPPAMYPHSKEQLRLVSGMSKRLRVDQGGVTLQGLPYGGPEVLELLRQGGPALQALCRWDPNDMSSLFIQDPADPAHWVTAACRWSDYADGLSWAQHLLIRKTQRQELASKESLDTLWRARMRLHEHWLDATRSRRRGDSLLAGRFAGLTSSKVLAGDMRSRAAVPCQSPLSRLCQPRVSFRNSSRSNWRAYEPHRRRVRRTRRGGPSDRGTAYVHVLDAGAVRCGAGAARVREPSGL
jgi:putative transposase